MLEGFPPGLRDRFEPRRVLGEGAMGTVYLATRRSDGGEVAIKLVREKGSASLRERFLREARSQARLEHPHVLRIFDWGTEDGDPYLVMEVLEGRSLELGPVDYDPLEVMLQIAEGLEAVHAEGLVHRDLKPANVFLCRDGRAVLTDFGLVRDPDLTALTMTGQVVGSLAYMPPEVLLGERPGSASDWYAWGVCLYRLREGELPFSAEQLLAVAQGDGMPEVRFQALAPDCAEAALLRRQLSADKAHRLAGRAAIEEFLRVPTRPASRPRGPRTSLPQSPTRGRKIHPWWAAAAILAITFVGLLLAPPWRAREPESSHPTSATTSPLGEGFGLEVREQLSAAGELMVDDAGGVHELPESPVPETWKPLVNADPHHYPLLLARVPALGRWYHFLGAGGAPEALPRGQREALGRADERFRVVGYPAPFGPMLRGPADPRSAEGLPESISKSGVPWPSPLGPWFAAALDAYRKGIAERLRLDGALPDLHRTEGRFLDEATRMQLGLFQSAQNPLASTLRELGRAPGSRPFVGDWTRPGTEHLVAFVYAIGRSIREEPETAPEAALAAQAVLAHLEAFRHSVFAWLPRSSLLGPPSPTLARDFCDLALRRVQLSGRGSLSAGRSEEVAEILQAASEIMARFVEEEDLATRRIVDLTIGEVASWAAREGTRDGAWLDALHPYLPVLARRPARYLETGSAVLDLWARRPEVLRDRPEVVRALIPFLQAMRGVIDRRRLEPLERCLSELRFLAG